MTEESERKKKEKKSVSENMEQLEHLYAIGGNAKWCACYGKLYKVSS